MFSFLDYRIAVVKWSLSLDSISFSRKLRTRVPTVLEMQPEFCRSEKAVQNKALHVRLEVAGIVHPWDSLWLKNSVLRSPGIALQASKVDLPNTHSNEVQWCYHKATPCPGRRDQRQVLFHQGNPSNGSSALRQAISLVWGCQNLLTPWVSCLVQLWSLSGCCGQSRGLPPVKNPQEQPKTVSLPKWQGMGGC